MAQSGPGIDVPGEWFIGDVNATNPSFGKQKALEVDNTVTPPVVKVNSMPINSNLEWFGNGSDGDQVVSGLQFLSRDAYYNNLTINNTSTLVPNGYRILVKETLTFIGTGLISGTGAPGLPGTAGGAGGGALPSGTLGGSTAGAAGGAATLAGGNAAGTTHSLGGVGGLGGAGNNGAAAGGTPTVPTPPPASAGGVQLTSFLPQAVYGRGQTGIQWTGGSGGAGGGGPNAAQTGGGGGSGGRVIIVIAKTITGSSGLITARGGTGGSGGPGTAVGGGGGGGGGGGAIILVYKQLTSFDPSTQLIVLGGVGGAAPLGGVPGAAGSPGTAVLVPV